PPTAPHTPSLHDALPIFVRRDQVATTQPHMVVRIHHEGCGSGSREQYHLPKRGVATWGFVHWVRDHKAAAIGNILVEPLPGAHRSEEHTSELQSREKLVC